MFVMPAISDRRPIQGSGILIVTMSGTSAVEQP